MILNKTMRISTSDLVIQEKFNKYLSNQGLDTSSTKEQIQDLWNRTYYDPEKGEFTRVDDEADYVELTKLLQFAYNNPELYDVSSRTLLASLMKGDGYLYFYEQLVEGNIKLKDLKALTCINDCNLFLLGLVIEDKKQIDLFNYAADPEGSLLGCNLSSEFEDIESNPYYKEEYNRLKQVIKDLDKELYDDFVNKTFDRSTVEGDGLDITSRCDEIFTSD